MPRPLHDSVWLLFPDTEYRNDGGVLVRDRGEDRLDATVVAVGPEVPDGLVGVGDRVLANRYDGMPVEHGGCVYRSVPCSRLLAVVE